ncbi:diguanylate cyclase [Sphingomonas sp. Leaf34]|uniref:putative bifunctional diguanylate cyclase/phosphodiesterase n=1 Tax=Sphingomonas sp. Leaf34 TaxID=1736216 RepID=UPI0006FBDDCA|nr:EAL domain-containing protein [Sphingomonas sp. Leaf34]KQN27342.1 diguanylate cyclase [Sphingomonas sp. Leaf34]
MSKIPPSLPPRISVAIPTLLGLREGKDPMVWGRIRAAQLLAVRRAALFLLATNVMASLVIAFLLRAEIPHWQIASWEALVIAAAVWVGFRRLATHDRGDGYASLRDLRTTVSDGCILAFVWSAVPVVFCTHASSGTTTGLGLTLAVLMTTVALAMAPLALATLIFLGYLGAAIVVQLSFAGTFAAAAGLLLFTLLLMTACLHRARALVLIRAGEIVLDDRDETVSLLLGEFEGGGADWLWETDATRRVVKPGARFAFACGVDAASIDNMPLLQLLAGPGWETGEFDTGLHTLADRLKRRESFRNLRLPVQIGGEERWWDLAAAPRFDDHGEFIGFRGVGSDVTEQRASADKVNRMARFDTLTGLPNRLMVNETLVKTMADADRWGGRYAFMMLDLDRFKAVNDTLGHPIGDRLLGRVSERLNQLMGVNETCGRLGGDEFAVVVRDASDLAAVEQLAERIIESLSRPYEIDAHTLHIGTSVGLAIGPRDGRTADMLVRSADLALYRAKDAGRGVFRRYEPELHVQAEERRVLEMALRGAIEKGEMHLVYQPIVKAGSETLCGFEALLRWTSPEFGSVSPTKFIPLAEETRLIGPIGAWVVRAACEEAAHWPSEMRIAVNVSADQLRNPSFVTTIAAALANTGVAAERLELEVTEGVFMHEGLGATQILDRVAELGVHLSLDDFGTGYASLGYLGRTRLSSLKIDRSFVRDAASGLREAVAIVRAGIALADSLGMATTAEGVETEVEYKALHDLGCTRVQGFYFGRPMSPEEARALANRGWKEAAAA